MTSQNLNHRQAIWALYVMIRLGQAFWHQEMAAVIDRRLWELAVTPWEVLILIGQHGNGPVKYMTWTHDRWTLNTC